MGMALTVDGIYMTKIYSDAWSVHRDGKVVMLCLNERTWLKLTEAPSNNDVYTFRILSGVFSGCVAYISERNITKSLLQPKN